MISAWCRWSGTARERSRDRRLRKQFGRRIAVEWLESRLTPSGLLNGDFSISDPSDPNYGWITRGGASIANGEGILDEGATVQTGFSQTFTIAPGTTALRFTIVASNLVSNGESSPADAFEVALLDTQTMLPLIGPPTGLSNTDSFLNIQQAGQVYYAPQVTVIGAGASGEIASLNYPELVTVDLSNVPANTQATLYFDLIGFNPATSSVRITSVTTLQGASVPPVSLSLDPATDSGTVGDGLTNVNPVNLIGVTDPDQVVTLDLDGDGFDDGTTTADPTGHFTFTGITLADGTNTVRVQAVNDQGSTIVSQTIVLDGQSPTGALATPTAGSTTNADLGYVDVQWSDPGGAGIDPSSFGVGDVTIVGVTIDEIQDLGNDRIRYRYDLDGDTLPLGPVDVVLVEGQVADLAGNVNARATQSFTLVAPTVQAPQANGLSLFTAQDAALAVVLTGTDSNDPPLPLTFTVTAGPSHGTLGGTAPNLTYTPNPGYFGADSFQFSVNNGSLDSEQATVAITVTGRPTADGQSVTTAQDTARAIVLTGSDPNTPPFGLTFVVTGGPAHGTLSGTAPNLTYTPNAGFSGADSFRFTVNNGTLDSTIATVSITVTAATEPAIRPPQTNDDAYTTPQGQVLTVAAPGVLGNDSSPDLAPTAVLVQGPSHGTLAFNADGSFTYTPAAGYSGADSFTYAAFAGSAQGTMATVRLTINAPTQPPTQTPTQPTTSTLLLPDTPYYNSLRRRHGINPARFDRYHPKLSAFIEMEINGIPRSATRIVLRNIHFNAITARRSFRKAPVRFEKRDPILGALFQLETPATGSSPRRLLPPTPRFDALRVSYHQDPTGFSQGNAYLGAVFKIEDVLNGGTSR